MSPPHKKNNRFVSIQSTLIQKGVIKKRAASSSCNNKDAAEIKLRRDAHSAVHAILADEPSDFILLPYSKFTASNKRRSNVYDHYNVLCLKNTKKSAGWLVCNYCLTGACLIEEGTKRFCTSTGTSQLHRHNETHRETPQEKTLHICTLDEKKMIAEAAAKSATLDVLPLSFCYQKKGFHLLAKALVELGQRYPTSTQIDIRQALPSEKTVRDTITLMADNLRSDFKSEELPNVLRDGGGITSDGVKIEETGKKYYDFLLHYLSIGREDPISKKRPWKIVRRLLFIARCSGTESASCLREMMDKQLCEYGCSIETFSHSFTFVTDCAATMPAVFGASVSPNRVPFSEKWIGCIAHQLNTAMKKAYDDVSDISIRQDIENLKKLIRLFKKGGMNEKLPAGKALKQEVPTRFGTTFDMVERFLLASSDVVRIIESSDQEAAKSASEVYDAIKCINSTFPSFQAIVTCFAPIRHAQTLLEAAETPTIMLVLPAVEDIKRKVQMIANGVRQGPLFSPVSPEDQSLASSTLAALDRIVLHDFWAASCLLHPGLRTLSFVHNTTVRAELKAKGKRLLQSLFNKAVQSSNITTAQVPTSSAIAPVGTTLGSSSFALASCMSFLDCSTDNDELTSYFEDSVSTCEKEMLKTNDGVVDYWLSKQRAYPTLSKIALRIIAVPASSASSERDFSLLKIAIGKQKCNSKDDIINDKAVLHSNLTAGLQ